MESKIKKILENKFQNKVKYNKEGNVVTYDSSINLEKMVTHCEINWVKLGQVVSVAIRFLDNLIDVSDYPLPEIDKITRQNRKIGLGIMGWANLLYKLAIPYDSQAALSLAEKIMSFIKLLLIKHPVH